VGITLTIPPQAGDLDQKLCQRLQFPLLDPDSPCNFSFIPRDDDLAEQDEDVKPVAAAEDSECR